MSDNKQLDVSSALSPQLLLVNSLVVAQVLLLVASL